MILKKEDAIRRIERYLQKNDTHPRIVNVNNPGDMDSIRQHFTVGNNVFKTVSDFSIKDENLLQDEMYNYLSKARGIVFLTGITSYYRLFGENKLQDFLNRIIGMSLTGLHLVVVSYQCEKYLSNVDQRYSQFVYSIDGVKQALPELIFTVQDMPSTGEIIVNGFQNIASTVEGCIAKKIFIRTEKRRTSYPHSLYSIRELNNAFEIICNLDITTSQLKPEFGTEKDWNDALIQIKQYGSWMRYVNDVFGTTTNLEFAVGNWMSFEPRKRWLYFIALKLYGAKKSWCLSEAIKNTENSNLFVKGVFRSLLHLSIEDAEFWNHYNERKGIIRSLGNPDSEVTDYCAMVKSKGENAIYYLTDATKTEKNLIFKNLVLYSEKIGRKNIIAVLKHVYPALYMYLQPYKFKIPLLDAYFQEYKYQKIINKIFPDFMQVVEDQAKKREFNLLLPPRSEKLDTIEKDGTVVYFMDAMGVEYLSYIMDQCRRRKLMAYTTICRCELPSITLFNKEFVNAFTQGGADFVPDKNGIKSIDDLKHHGVEEFDFTNNEYPTYISRELDIIGETIEKIATKLMSGTYKRAVMIADHGSSRLCVISKRENKWGSESNAEHSGRCCPISEIDEKPSCAIEENGYWVLANYDRFKGGRKANVEVHGGATLEEVVIPIIEITYSPEYIEIELLNRNIKFSRRKKDATIRLFSKTKLDNLSIRVSGLNNEYEGTSEDGQTFVIALPELRKSGEYNVEVYCNNNLLKSGLKFNAKNSDFSERKLL